MNIIRLLLLAGTIALAFTWPAATQGPNSLGSQRVQDALQRITVPQTGDIVMLYRGQNGDFAYTQSSQFMFAVPAANAAANFGGL